MSISSIIRFYTLALLMAVPCFSQRPALNSPVIRFSDANGKPLVGGKLFSYSAGTTTPLQTFTDSTTGAMNANPVILDSTGSAKVFLGPNVYKFTLQNSAGVVQWTEDNIAQGMFTSGSVTSFTGNQGTTRVGAVTTLTGDYSCAMISGAVCSLPTPPTLYNQTINTVAGASPQQPILTFLPGTVGSIYTFTASGGTGYTAAPSVTFTGGGCAVEPTGGVSVASGAVTNPVITTSGSGCITPPTPGFSGGGGSGASGATTLTPLGISCANNPAATSTDCTFTFAGGTGNAQACVRADVTGSRSINGIYQNTTNGLLYMSGTVNTSGSSVGSYFVWQGTSSPSLSGYGNTATATVSGGSPGFFEAILPGYFYQLRSSDPAITGISKWTEVTGCGSSTSTAGLAPPITNNLTIGSTGAGNPSRDSGIAPGNVPLLTTTTLQSFTNTATSALAPIEPINFIAPNVTPGTGDNSAGKIAISVGSTADVGTDTVAILAFKADAVQSYAFVGSHLDHTPFAVRGNQIWLSGSSNFINHPLCVPVIVGNISQVGTDSTVANGLNVGTTNQLQIDCSGNETTSGSVSAGSMTSGGSPVCTASTGCTGGGGGVLSVNSLTGALTVAAGTGIGVSASGSTITITNTGVGSIISTTSTANYGSSGGCTDTTGITFTGATSTMAYVVQLTSAIPITGGTVNAPSQYTASYTSPGVVAVRVCIPTTATYSGSSVPITIRGIQ